MGDVLKQNQAKVDIDQLIDSLQEVERTREIEGIFELFSPFWQDIDEDPDFSGVEPRHRGELYRLAGIYLMIYGYKHAKNEYSSHSIVLFEKAVECFDDTGNAARAALAKSSIAAVYQGEGRVEEAIIYFEEAESVFENDQLNVVNLLIQATKIYSLFWVGRYSESYQTIKDYEIPMELSNDSHMVSRYYNHAGIICSKLGKFEESREFLRKAALHCEILKNWSGLADVYNNTAMCDYRDGEYESALKNVNYAMEVHERAWEHDRVVHTLDTKALVLMSLEQYDEALDTIDEVIKMLEGGRHHNGLIDAYWAKVNIHLFRGERALGIGVFLTLCEFAKREIGEYVTSKYIDMLANIVFVKQGKDYRKEVDNFKSELLNDAISVSGADFMKAARRLNLTHKEFIAEISGECPTLFLEYGVSPTVFSDAIS